MSENTRDRSKGTAWDRAMVPNRRGRGGVRPLPLGGGRAVEWDGCSPIG